jgi:exodeoxyribonuclease VII small subunit
MVKAKNNQPDFEQLLRELELIVGELELGQLKLEQMLEKYATGVKLLADCRGMLQQAEQLLPQESKEDE